GGDFVTQIDRTQWGIDYLVDMGMTKVVDIKIQAEAVKQ
ncbi:polyisoprenoid-binding protein, partial [Salmonella enterica]|nr:polyisoprenoid-binding protein [Salmonella enterica subsp. enterica serovar Typhimurium]EGG3165410.1 polyisoprenoid-binding protein [Salmonella enterica]ELC7452150.1 polyisoprenoid-binding protein [Salmonella enterica subsp. enterica serovar Infantis]EGJ3679905.1 polyisoprenoid-binding protein [Salmonella enterica]EGL2669127.1 polyisoprenoid-binding protein [Salmonella enterica]